MAGNILVVDDDRDLVASTKAYLEARGYTVRVAHGGEDARAELERGLPDLMVLDIMMDNDTDGFTLAHSVKENPETRDIPLIIVSGFTSELGSKTHVFEPHMYEEWPAIRFFEKPAKLSDLAEAIAQALAERAAPSSKDEA